MADLSRLRQDWQTLLKPWAVAAASADRWFEDISKHYSESGRGYHTLDHIGSVLELVRANARHTSDLAAVELAAWLHDVIYDSRASNNEEQSAAYASNLCAELGIGVSQRVKALILSTKTHEANGDRDAEVLLDADLAVLGADETVYRDYASKIRLEYSWVPAKEYQAGRRFVLDRFLTWPAIYHYLTELEAPARRNIAAEIAGLFDPSSTAF